MRVDRIEPIKPQKKNFDNPDKFDPFQYDGPDANVFKIKIDFVQPKEESSLNRKVASDKSPFNSKTLVAKYDPTEICDHGNKYDEKESILFVESTNIKIHHTKEVEILDRKVHYRPTVCQPNNLNCFCKKFYTGEDEKLVRVSPANNKMTGRSNTLHFVSFEYYFSFLGQLLASGETLSGFIKSRKFMDEVFLD